MSKNYDAVREDLMQYFDSSEPCPLTDEYIESMLNCCYYAISAHVEMMFYLHDELKIPFTKEFQKIREDNR